MHGNVIIVIALCKESTPKGRGLALTPKGFYAKAGMIFLFKEISLKTSGIGYTV